MNNNSIVELNITDNLSNKQLSALETKFPGIRIESLTTSYGDSGADGYILELELPKNVLQRPISPRKDTPKWAQYLEIALSDIKIPPSIAATLREIVDSKEYLKAKNSKAEYERKLEAYIKELTIFNTTIVEPIQKILESN
jgi:hypothetical protein